MDLPENLTWNEFQVIYHKTHTKYTIGERSLAWRDYKNGQVPKQEPSLCNTPISSREIEEFLPTIPETYITARRPFLLSLGTYPLKKYGKLYAQGTRFELMIHNIMRNYEEITLTEDSEGYATLARVSSYRALGSSEMLVIEYIALQEHFIQPILDADLLYGPLSHRQACMKDNHEYAKLRTKQVFEDQIRPFLAVLEISIKDLDESSPKQTEPFLEWLETCTPTKSSIIIDLTLPSLKSPKHFRRVYNALFALIYCVFLIGLVYPQLLIAQTPANTFEERVSHMRYLFVPLIKNLQQIQEMGWTKPS
jgi:hypothetical protein